MGTKHLTEADRQRIRTLYFDGGKSKAEIHTTTTFSLNHIQTAMKVPSSQVAKSWRVPRWGTVQTRNRKLTHDTIVHHGR
ncbi:uncharacterized protein BCR38DRAFT_106259 [Pseudomassariella vexata]|uniref:Uncharacterized protein n=1 Tax=Pseudomassariella vexata TaxID=1141098 RepID=A0A1Y2EFR8_9PEZI|nr:uncharacterized protein BCR38DRAFT_106259 [Pseudomassariella vexata]ORY70423.1 hypothetical protein BCR38DRAFT_106259 [Pseudomassariella vexata]